MNENKLPPTSGFPKVWLDGTSIGSVANPGSRAKPHKVERIFIGNQANGKVFEGLIYLFPCLIPKNKDHRALSGINKNLNDGNRLVADFADCKV